MPLERNDEQELWRRFKESCDTVFAKRKESAAEADAERHQHLVAKETVCQTLEAAVLQPAQTSAQASIPQATVSRTALLRESAAAWSGIGPVPRAVEAALEARYRTATAALTQQIDAAQREQRNAMRLAVQSKLALCLQAEAALAAAENADFADALATIQAKWHSLGTDDTTTLRLLAQRLARALACAAHIDPAYLAQLQSNRSVVRQELLRTEIILSIDSPAESARERLQLQVEVLQSALKSNTATPTAQTQLQALCGLPVLLEPDDAARLLRVVEQLAA